MGRAHAVSILSVMAQPWRGENGEHRLGESTHDHTKPSHRGQAGGHLPLGLSRPWGVTKEGALREGVSGEVAETKGSCFTWGAPILPPREPLRCPDPCPGCLQVPGGAAHGSLPGRDLDSGVGWSCGRIPALTYRGDLEVRRRPLGAVPGWASRAIPAAREAWGMLGGPCRVHAPQRHPRHLGGPVTSAGSQRNEDTRATEGRARVDWEPPAPRESGEGLALWGASGSRLPAPPTWWTCALDSPAPLGSSHLLCAS